MDSDLTFLGISMPYMNRSFRMFFGFFGILVFFTLQKYFYNKLTNEFHLSEYLFLAAVEFLGVALTAPGTVIKIITKKQPLKSKLMNYFIIALFVFSSKALYNYSSLHMSESTSYLFKSCRLVPTMIGNIAFLNKSPPVYDVLAVVFIVSGLAALSIAGFTGIARFDISGVISTLLLICFDSCTQNFNERMMRGENVPQQELIGVVYSTAAAFSITATATCGQFASAFATIVENPISLAYLAFYAAVSAFGIQFMILLTKQIGSLSTCMLTSIRQPLIQTIYAMKFATLHLFAIFMLSLGLALKYISEINFDKEPDFGQYASENPFTSPDAFKFDAVADDEDSPTLQSAEV